MSLPSNVALISESPKITIAELAPIAAALQKQVTRDFSPIWKIDATISVFGQQADIPPGYWPIIIKDNLDEPGAAGYHVDEHGQPVSYVDDANGDIAELAVTCSHELLEMLADPDGNRLVVGYMIGSKTKRVRYLVEVCDPSEASTYMVNDMPVSDFLTPSFYDPVVTPGARYSFTGAIVAPRTIIKGGYISFVDGAGNWFQQTWFGGARPAVKQLGALRYRELGFSSLRHMIDSLVAKNRVASKKK